MIHERHEERETCLCATGVYVKIHRKPALVSTCELLLSVYMAEKNP